MSVETLRGLVEEGNPKMSIRRQCDLLGLNRASYYYEPAKESDENLRLMDKIDREYTEHPFTGSRKMTKVLVKNGEEVNRKRVQRLMQTRCGARTSPTSACPEGLCIWRPCSTGSAAT
jgi:putative transposase